MTGGDSEYFMESEAATYVGRRYRNTAWYSGVRPGSTGRVSGVYAVDGARRRCGVDVTWEGVPGGSPLDMERGGLTDGFSRGQLFTVFSGGPDTGRRAMVPLDGPDGGPEDAVPATPGAGPEGARGEGSVVGVGCTDV